MSASEHLRMVAVSAQMLFAGTIRPPANEIAEVVDDFRKALQDAGVDPQTANDSAVRAVNTLVRFAEASVDMREAADELLTVLDEQERLLTRPEGSTTA